MSGALDGITVVAVEQAVAAPYASCRLADAGARVIKIERPDGDFARRYDVLARGESAYFVWLNRGKESCRLDLKGADDAALLERMIAGADVFLQNLKPGSLERLGFGIAALRERHPALITCSITGFGDAGEYAHLKAYDLIVQAETGLCSITGTADGPARVGVSVCDIAAGLNAHAAILEALFLRARTGEARHIDVSLFDAVADWMNVPYLQRAYGGRDTARGGVHHPSLAPYGAYRCADGIDVVFSVQNDREWVGFCERFLGRPDATRDARFADNMARLAHRTELDAMVSARFGELSAEAAMRALESAGLAYGRLNDIDALAAHPHLRRLAVETGAGTVEVIAPAARVTGTADPAPAHESAAAPRVPGLGEHDASLRTEFEAPAAP